jgi:diguanylate cyclase (GGDEF)-like protein
MSQAGKRNPSHGSILVVDDDPAFRALVSTLLKSKSYRVVEASNADEASAMYSDKETKLAIIDYRMPGADGMSWIQKLRDSGRATPVVFCSGTWCDQKTFNWLRNILRVSLIVKKPIVPAVFLQQIESLLPAETKLAIREDGIAEFDDVAESYDDERSVQSPDGLVHQLMQIRTKLDMKSALKVAQANYLQDLGNEWSQLVRTANALKNEPHRRDLLDDAINMSHKIKGTAGSLNLIKVGEIGGKIENFLRMFDPDETTEMEVIWSETFRALAEGEQAVKSAIKDQSPVTSEAQAAKRLLLVSADYGNLLGGDHALSVQTSETIAGAINKVKRVSYEAAIFDLNAGVKENFFTLARDLRINVDGVVPIALIQAEGVKLKAEELAYIGCSEIVEPPETTYMLESIYERLLAIRREQKQRILIVDDDEVLCNFVNTVLSAQGFNVQALNDPIMALDTVRKFKPDLLLLDVMMPGLTGYEVCRMVREDKEWGKIPILFLTGKTTAESRAAAFQAGADDFLQKPVLMEELITRISSQLARVTKDNTDVAKDEATGLLNEGTFVKQAQGLIARSLAQGQHLSMALLAVDDVDQIRIVHGTEHLRQAITALGVEMRMRFKAEDLRGRIGYDAFALVCTREYKETVAGALELMLHNFSQTSFFGERGNFKVSFSAGVADSLEDGTGLKDLLRCAYRRMSTQRQSRDGVISAVG